MPPRLPCYTEAELSSPDGPNLPGLWTPAQIDPEDPYAFFRDTDWQPVLNLAVVTEEMRANGQLGLGMLTASRPESEQTHPNVVSTPTQWITDRAQFELMLETQFFNVRMMGAAATSAGLPVRPTMHLGEINPSHFAVLSNIEPHPQTVGGVTLPLGRFTQRILAEKLGFEGWYDPDNAQKLKRAGLSPSIGNMSLSRLLAGFSYVGENGHDEPVYEPIVMVGAVVHTPFPKLFPRQTARYSNLSFTPLDAFKDNVRERNVGNLIQLDSQAEEVMMCVRGLCLSTGAEMSVGPDLMRHMASFELGKTYDAEAAGIIADLLAERDRRGEQLAARVNDVLGYDAFAGRRVAFERTDISKGLTAEPPAPAVDDDQAAEAVDLLDRSLATAGQGFSFQARKH